MEGVFKYYDVKITAKGLPKLVRVDPFAILFVRNASTQQWEEEGRTEIKANDANPRFATSFKLPADAQHDRQVDLRVDFYNKKMTEEGFIGSVEVNLATVAAEDGHMVNLPLALRKEKGLFGKLKAVCTISAEEAYNNVGGKDEKNVSWDLELEQTQYYGVKMKTYFVINRAASGHWTPVFQSPKIGLDQSGWGQFPTCQVRLSDLAQGETSKALLIQIYRHKMIGTHRLLGYFQTSVDELHRATKGDFLTFTTNSREDLVSADVLVAHTSETGGIFNFGLKLINVCWRAELLTEENHL
eukprot:Plantae.Rhodophyta-Hildenbrandia_rubra.ctg18006.p1 GENE.Plantae.Rhodophyta-Hildenbrandia_rubra.ctg18006~~Plantae.Rhodophyta-Hildenbrandia_rubra.ctg18006.p1  ORF type:complete len:299 (-),score=46.63 Plantae.Rhodophyta-Hildenbrandia_rubra.ctg18006:790-1686(-)